MPRFGLLRSSMCCFRLLYSLCLLGSGWWLCSGGVVLAQQPDTSLTLSPLVVESTRAGVAPLATAPFAVAVLTCPEAQAACAAAPTLARRLGLLPGLYLADRGHAALGERVQVRGMGYQAAFGVRGVQVVLDGIPLTLPDGQAVLEAVEPALVQRAELLRGPASLYWGNGSGGTLFLSTTTGADGPGVIAEAGVGSEGLWSGFVQGAWTGASGDVRGYVSARRRDGFRVHSAEETVRAGLAGRQRLGARTTLGGVAAMAWQDVLHPGSLTLAEWQADDRAAHPGHLAQQAGKRSTQGQAGVTLEHHAAANTWLRASAYGLVRHLDNPLSFAYITLDRQVGGARLGIEQALPWFTLHGGLEASRQRDDRLNRGNDGGVPSADIRLDQLETVTTGAAFLRFVRPFGPLHLEGGVRLDHLRFASADAWLGNGDQSGSRTFQAWSPAVGAAYVGTGWTAFVHVARAFDSPTTTELVNRPGVDGGFNPEVGLQYTQGVEAGVRRTEGRLGVDVAVFRLAGTDRLASYQLPSDDRTYFRNAGQTRHTGLESSVAWQGGWWEARAAYMLGRFVFVGNDRDGLRLPGVPSHRLAASLAATWRGWTLGTHLDGLSGYPVDDANTTWVPGFTTWDVQLGHRGWPLGAVQVRPQVHLLNGGDARYVGSVTINGSNGRFYEPAPGRTWWLRVQMQPRP